MNQQLQRKVDAVVELTSKIKEAKTIVAFDYPGLSVAQITKLRRALLEANCEMKVYKNNISRRAAKEAGLEEFSNHLVGPLALVSSSEDVVAPAKVLVEYFDDLKIKGKSYKDVIKTGVIEGKVVDVNKIKELASLPNRETMLTMLAVGLLTPVKHIAVGLNMIVEKGEEINK